MALTLTVGENTYLTRADATTYFEGRLHSTAWDNATDTERDQALVMATKAIDRLTLRGTRKVTTQTLAFPRCYPADPRYADERLIFNGAQLRLSGHYYCEKDTPQAVLDAACEEALALLDRGNHARYKLQADGVESFSLGDLSETYARTSRRPELLSSEARDLLRPYRAGAVPIT